MNTLDIASSLSIPGSERLTEPTSIAMVKAMQRQVMVTTSSQTPIATSYVRQGQGHPPILLIHGFDSSLLEFRRLLPLLAAHTTTWAVDLLGFGFTDRPTGCVFSPDSIKTHLYDFWKTLIDEPVILVGASMGGAAAIDFALTYPQAVQQLVLLDSAGFTAGPSMGKYLVPPLGWLATTFLKNPKVRQKISINAYYDPSYASADALCCAALHLLQPGWSQALIAFTQSGGYGSFRDRLAHLQPPTLILWGKADRILGTADATQFHQAIPNSKLIWIAESGHVPHLEQPKTTANHILQFIGLQSG